MKIIRFILLGCLMPLSLWAKEPPIKISARSLTYHHDTGRVVADGGARAIQGDGVLNAPHLEYDTTRSELIAWGGVTIDRPGEKLSLDSVVIGQNMSQIKGDSFTLDLADGASVRSDKIYGEDGETVFKDVSYTACKREKDCELTWEIRANELTRDEEDIEYYSAWLKLWGVPVFYTPYLMHPDPAIQSQSGFLFPGFGNSSQLGFFVETPYYLAISDHEELTVKPLFTSKEGINWGAEHHRKFSFGEIKTEGSYTSDDSIDHDRGHVFSYSKFNLDSIWRAYADIEYTTDDTYLRKYDLSRDEYLHSDLGIEGLSNRSYFALKLHRFDDLRADVDDDSIPEVLPTIHLNRVFEPNSFGAYWTFGLDTVSLYYPQDEEQHKASADLAWTVPYTTPIGLQFETELSLRGDVYYYNDAVEDLYPEYAAGTRSRYLPQVSVKADMPFIKTSESSTQILNPIVQLVASSQEDFNDEILNTDSVGTIFDDSNVFDDNRYLGLDRAETGTRLNYGLDWRLFGEEYGIVNAFVGQTYRIHSDDAFPENSGLEDELSDYVGRLLFNPVQWFDLIYRFRLDKDSFSAARNELGMRVGQNRNYLFLDYIYDEKNDEDKIDDTASEEVYIKGSVGLSKSVSVFVEDRYNLSNDSQTLIGGGLIFKDDCFTMKIGARKEYTTDRDYQGDEKVYINFIFKTLGGIGED